MKILISTLAVLLLPQIKQPDLGNIPINQIQVIGSHNSYKQAIEPAMFKFIRNRDSVGADKLDYEHLSVTEQLNLGLRGLEIDFYVDTKGGRYAHPKGLDWARDQYRMMKQEP